MMTHEKDALSVCPSPRRKHVVMYSSGSGSWAAAQRVADEHGTDDLWLVFADVSIEDADNYRFLVESAASIFGVTLPKWWHHPWKGRSHTRAERARNALARLMPRLVWLRDGRTPFEVFRDDRFLGNSRLANCSKILKQQPSRAWLEENCDPTNTTVYLGIDWSEEHRTAANTKGYLPWVTAYPLCEPPYDDKTSVLAALRKQRINPPALYAQGFAHANCGGGCVRSGQGQFAHLLLVNPERYAWWESEEEKTRQHLGKDVTILRDRRGGTVTPLTLRAFRERHEDEPEQTDMFDIGGCGCFSEAVPEPTRPRVGAA